MHRIKFFSTEVTVFVWAPTYLKGQREIQLRSDRVGAEIRFDQTSSVAFLLRIDLVLLRLQQK